MIEDRTLSTDRLVMRPLLVSDAAALFSIFKDDETLRYWNSLPHQSVQETASMIDQIISREGSCYWALCEPVSDTTLGYVGFVGNQGTPGLVYLLNPEYWGRGLATEAVRAAVAFGLDQKKHERIELWIHPENFASIKVALKVGFTFRGRSRTQFVNAAIPHDLLVYGLKAVEWFHVAGALAGPETDQNFYGLRPVLAVADIVDALDFYRDKLDFTVEFCHGDPPVLAGVMKGEWSSSAVRIRFVKSDVEIQSSGWLYILVGPDLDGLFESYRNREVKIISEPETQPWGIREFEIADLNGHRLRFGTL